MAETPPTNPNHAENTAGPTMPALETDTAQPLMQEASSAGAVADERALTDLVGEALGEVGAWAGANPLAALLLATVLGTLAYFFWFVHPFYSGTRSALVWARSAWNPEGDQSYGAFVPLISLGFFIYHWGELRRAPKRGSNAALGWVAVGIGLFVLAVRCLQPRMALLSIPFLLYGIIVFLWGKAVGRIVLFPCAFLLFMIPVGAITQATFKLQFLVTGTVAFLSRLIGVGIHAVGTSLQATDNSFDFEIAEGCSGIRSLMAMVMITAAYVHLTQTVTWKKVVIFASSIVFAIIGNTGRVFSIILVAKFWDKKVAGGVYHDTSGWLFFPIAMGAMLACDWLVNLDYSKYLKAIQEAAEATDSEAEWEQTEDEPGDSEIAASKPATFGEAAAIAADEPAHAAAVEAPSAGVPLPSSTEEPHSPPLRRYDY